MPFFLLMVYSAFVYIRPQEIFPELADYPVIRVVAAAAAFFAFFSNKIDLQKFWKTHQGRYLFYFFAVAAFSRVPLFWLGGVLDGVIFLAQILVLYFLILNLIDTPQKVRFYIVFIIVMTVLLSFQGIQQDITGEGWGGQTPLIEGRRDEEGEFIPETMKVRVRGLGIFEDPNDYGQMLVMAIPLLLTMSYGLKTGFFVKLLSLSALGSILYAVYLTNSRGGYMALISLFAAYFILKFGATKGATPAALAVMGLVLFGPTRAGGVMTMDASGRGRVEAWSAGIAMFKSAPLIGVGMDWFKRHHELTAHNSFVLTFAETGLLGAFFWVGLFYIFFKEVRAVRAYPNLEDPHQLKEFYNCLMISMIAFLTASFFLSRTWIPISYMWVAMGSTIMQQLQRENKGLKVEMRAEDGWKIFAITIFGIVFMYFLHLFLRTLPIVGDGYEEAIIEFAKHYAA